MPEAVSAQYGLNLTSGFNIHSPEKMARLFARYGHQGKLFFMKLFALGWESPVAQDSYSHFEDYWIHDSFKVKANVSDPGVGESALVTLHADSLDDNNKYYPQQWDNVLLPTEVVATIISIDDTTDPTAPVLTIRPNYATDTIGALSAGDELAIHSNNFSEGGDMPAGRATGAIEYPNYTQIFKQAVQATGSELTRREYVTDWVTVQNPGGASKPPLLWSKALLDVDYRMALAISGALLFSKRRTNTGFTDAATGYSPNSTIGLIPEIRSKGTVYPKAMSAFTIATDFHAINKLIIKNYASNDVFFGCGIDRRSSLNELLKAYIANTMVDYTKEVAPRFYPKSGPEVNMGIEMGFTYFKYNEVMYHLNTMEEFHHPKVAGISGYPYEDMAVILPMNKIKVQSTGKELNAIGYRYKELGGYSRRMEVVREGSANLPNPTSGLDLQKYSMRAEIGGHFVGMNSAILLTES